MNKISLPRPCHQNIGLGVGLRKKHFAHVLQSSLNVDWFEIITENFIDDPGSARNVLLNVAKQVPVVMHGVSLSIGNNDRLDMEYLEKLKELSDWVEPAWISDHLCWTGLAHGNTHDILPMPLTQESLEHVVERVGCVQDFLGRMLVLETPSSYLQHNNSEMQEWEFLSQLALRSGCGLLLNINNIQQSASDHAFDAATYIQHLPAKNIVQLSMSKSAKTYSDPTHLFSAKIIKLYQLVQKLTGGVSVLLECGSTVPEYPLLVKEAQKARLSLMQHVKQTA